MEDTAIAIIGMGARFPGASDLCAFRELAWSGAVATRPVPPDRWDHSRVWAASPRARNRTPAAAGAFLDDITSFAPAAFGVTPRRARIMDPQQRLMLETTRQALENAGYAQRRLADGRVGVYVGACSSDHRMLVANAVNLNCDLAGRCGEAPPLTEDQLAAVSAALPPIQGYSIVGQQLNMIAANVSQAWDFNGPSFALDTACSSALAALHEAVAHLRAGLIDAAVVGGVYVQLDPVMMVCFSRVGALSPTDVGRPFQAAADGFVLGEGVGAIIVKRLADALRDGDRVIAVVRGLAMNNDGAGAGPLTPRQSGQEAVLAAAWRDAGLEPASAGFIEAHGTATPAGDGIELAALQSVFGAGRGTPLPFASIKANIGHGLASAGIASLIRAALAVHEGVIPPQPLAGPLRAELSNGAAGGLRVSATRETWREPEGTLRRAGVSGFGFGGTNVHVVLEQPAPHFLSTRNHAPVAVAPSRLVEQRFWLMDEGKRRPLLVASGTVTPEEATAAASGSTEITTVVYETIAAVTAWSTAELRSGQRLVADLGFDSLTSMEFATVLGKRLPGRSVPASAFRPGLTVGDVIALVAGQTANPPADPAPLQTREITLRGSWLAAHRPGGVAVAPLAALWWQAASPRDDRRELTAFTVLRPAPADAANEVRLALETSEDGAVSVRTSAGLVAQGRHPDTQSPFPASERLELGALTPGPWSLEKFYAEAAFHSEPIQALSTLPQISETGAQGRVRTDRGPIVGLDGLLQLALYWLATRRGESAVATGVNFGWVGPWPAGGELTARVRLSAEGEGSWQGEAELVNDAGQGVAHWSGIRAGRLSATSPAESTPASEAGDWPELQAFRARKAGLLAHWRMPYFQVHAGSASGVSRMGDREVINFSSYNYLALAGDARVRAATEAAVARYGTSVSASRIASGERPVHAELERALASWLGCEDALTMVSGHATNVATIGHLFGPGDLVLHDALAHDCIISGAKLAGARRIAFPHNDTAALARLLARERSSARRVLIAIEGVYSMDGDVAPLAEIIALKQRHDAFLLVDEAHSLGVLGATGRGIGEHAGVAAGEVDLWMGTLSKSLASCGGYLAGRADLIDYLRFTLPGFVYSVGLSPANAAAAQAALALLAAEPERVKTLRARAGFFRDACRIRGLDTGASAHSAVIPVITGADELALGWAQALGDEGINVQPIFHPAVEPGKARLRFFLASDHTEAQLTRTADLLGRLRAET
jgi:8-amino-7-oxononanoate synthase